MLTRRALVTITSAALASAAKNKLLRPPGQVSIIDFGADPTGQADSGDAVVQALAAVSGGGVVVFPSGEYRIVASPARAFIPVPSGITLRGEGRALSVIHLESTASDSYGEFLRISGTGVVVQDLAIRRRGTFPSVIINFFQGGALTLKSIHVDGGDASPPDSYCHGLQLGLGDFEQDGISLLDSQFVRLTSCLLMTNASKGRLKNVLIARCRMQSVDLNCPNGAALGVLIKANVIDGRGGPGFGVSLAHVSKAVVTGNVITSSSMEAVHIEDYSTDVVVEHNRMFDCAKGERDAFAYVQIISGSGRVVVRSNHFGGRAGAVVRPISFIAVQAGGVGDTPGGRSFSSPTNIRIAGNTFDAGQDVAVSGVYLEHVDQATVVSNAIIGGPFSLAVLGKPPRFAISVFGGTAIDIAGNTLHGWDAALIESAGAAGAFRANKISQCRFPGPGILSGGLTLTGNLVSPL